MDETLETKMHHHPALLLIQPTDHRMTPSAAAAAAADGGGGGGGGVAGNGDIDVAEVTAEGGDSSSKAGEVVLCCLEFIAVLMRNCVNKHVFSSSEVRIAP